MIVAIKDAGAFGPEAYWRYSEDPNGPRAANGSAWRPKGVEKPRLPALPPLQAQQDPQPPQAPVELPLAYVEVSEEGPRVPPQAVEVVEEELTLEALLELRGWLPGEEIVRKTAGGLGAGE